MAPLRIIQIGTAPMVHSAHAAAALRGLPETFQLEGIVEEDPELLRRAAGNSAFAGLPFLSWEEVLRRRPDALVIGSDRWRRGATPIWINPAVKTRRNSAGCAASPRKKIWFFLSVTCSATTRRFCRRWN